VIWLALFVAVVIAVLTVAAVLGRVDGSLADPTSTMSHVPLPEDPLTPGDLESLRFDTAMRGYRMSQVDGVLDRLQREIRELQEELARMRDGTSTVAGPGTLAGSPAVDGSGSERQPESTPSWPATGTS
jgi:DivIVA domain-containing protein